MKRPALLLCFLLFAARVSAADLEVSDGWIRLLPVDVPAAGYFQLLNKTKTAVKLVGASSPAFGHAMLHKSAEDNGRNTMMHVDEVDVPADGKLVFRPGGYHIMLMKPTRELRIGEKVPVTLEFAGGEKITAPFEVRGPSGSPRR